MGRIVPGCARSSIDVSWASAPTLCPQQALPDRLPSSPRSCRCGPRPPCGRSLKIPVPQSLSGQASRQSRQEGDQPTKDIERLRRLLRAVRWNAKLRGRRCEPSSQQRHHREQRRSAPSWKPTRSVGRQTGRLQPAVDWRPGKPASARPPPSPTPTMSTGITLARRLRAGRQPRDPAFGSDEPPGLGTSCVGTRVGSSPSP